MRPTEKQAGAVWRLLEQWAKDHPLQPNQRQMAGLFGVSRSLLSQWKFCESMMQPDDMASVAAATGITRTALGDAVQEDMPRILEHHQTRRSTERPPSSSGGSR